MHPTVCKKGRGHAVRDLGLTSKKLTEVNIHELTDCGNHASYKISELLTEKCWNRQRAALQEFGSSTIPAFCVGLRGRSNV